MISPGIRETIDAALRRESETNQLSRRLEQQLPRLRDKLEFPEEEPVAALMAFITDYVESVPGCLRLATAVSKHLGFYDYAAPFLYLAEDYFLQPPDELPADGGLEALLDEAFLAHRLLEEVNDHHMRHLQRPLLPVDMTEANIIVHHLLGDEFATRLEQLVQFTAAQLLRREHVWDEVRSGPGQAETASLITTGNLRGSPQQIKLRLAS
ncbi:MAG: hypothetical protein DRR04_08570 [Gammaproteobacteria bacterium]|nr:MAG: hypothetical protein DRQ97_05330 [Gammaproteobacteria bacterium]RLA59397.1 MAG: hypothetical protein DRR04_08570 [Gammaproteobacteria bacterium]